MMLQAKVVREATLRIRSGRCSGINLLSNSVYKNALFVYNVKRAFDKNDNVAM